MCYQTRSIHKKLLLLTFNFTLWFNSLVATTSYHFLLMSCIQTLHLAILALAWQVCEYIVKTIIQTMCTPHHSVSSIKKRHTNIRFSFINMWMWYVAKRTKRMKYLRCWACTWLKPTRMRKWNKNNVTKYHHIRKILILQYNLWRFSAMASLVRAYAILKSINTLKKF